MVGRATTWQRRARSNPHKPEPVDVIPEPLKELGKVFFPIPRGRKGYGYPHHMDEFRHEPDSEVLNAYLESGWGYGIACAGDLAVVDIDDMEKVDEIIENLPETCYQLSGSREGVHLFYYVPGLVTRKTLYEPAIHDCDEDEHSCRLDMDGNCERIMDWDHIGEVKCDPHGYVVGPGSVHPSGNKYGPLEGDYIAEMERETLMDSIEPFLKPDEESGYTYDPSDHYEDTGQNSIHEFYEITADDVMPAMKAGERISHPVHGSSTGSNFMKNSDGKTFTCWRCTYGHSQGCGLNGVQYLAVEQTGKDCEMVRRYWHEDPTLHYWAWFNAVTKGLASLTDPPYNVVRGYAKLHEELDDDYPLVGPSYYDMRNALIHETEIELRRRR